MKKKQITFDRKLSLDRQTVGKLDISQLDAIAGGNNIYNKINKEEADTVSCAAHSCNTITETKI